MEKLEKSLVSATTSLLRSCAVEQSPIVGWQMICGASIAAQTSAESFTAGRLAVRVQDRAWRKELTAMAPQLLARLNQVSPVKVTSIEFLADEA